jgi:hypothetical protein
VVFSPQAGGISLAVPCWNPKRGGRWAYTKNSHAISVSKLTH